MIRSGKGSATASVVAAAVTVVGCAVGCSARSGEPTAITAEAITGTVIIDPSCAPSYEAYIREAVRWERTVVASPAFEGCIDIAMRGAMTLSDLNDPGPSGARTVGPYYYCNEWVTGGQAGDPVAPPQADPLEWQIANVVRTARSANDLVVHCDSKANHPNWEGYAGDVKDVGTAPEVLSLFRENLDGFQQNTGIFAYLETTGLISHEVTHSHNYHHGDRESADSCGYSSPPSKPGNPPDVQPAWFARHTVPWIVRACVQEVLLQSLASCGEPASLCGASGLHLIQRIDDPQWCYCAQDPTVSTPPIGGPGGGDTRCGKKGLPPCHSDQP